MNEITCNITRPIAVLGENSKGYTKEVNFVSWNGGNAKLDLRDWNPGHDRCGKGITLNAREGQILLEALEKIYSEMDGCDNYEKARKVYNSL